MLKGEIWLKCSGFYSQSSPNGANLMVGELESLLDARCQVDLIIEATSYNFTFAFCIPGLILPFLAGDAGMEMLCILKFFKEILIQV